MKHTISQLTNIYALWCKLQESTDEVKAQRFGQWFLNTYHSELVKPEIFYAKDKYGFNLICRDTELCTGNWDE